MDFFGYYINAVEYKIKEFLMKRVGWQTKRKIVVIESDDWGSIRMPSKEIFFRLLKDNKNFTFESGYNKYDTLASESDLENLLEVLSSVKDGYGNYPIITLNSVLTNPDFEKIKENNFERYYSESFIKTLSKYPNHNNSFKLWQEGIYNNLFKPQFHAKEHLNVEMWMNLLRKNIPEIMMSFDNKIFFSSVSEKDDIRKCPLKSYDVLKKEDYKYLRTSIHDGLNLFRKIFGFDSKSFIAPNYLWDKDIEQIALSEGIEYFQGGFKQLYSNYYSKITRRSGKFHFCGELSKNGLVYLTRNCLFEPSQNKQLNFDYCLRNIKESFRLNKPAVICSHRLNYIGDLYPKNRDGNLFQFQLLLKQIVKLWPEVEFMSSDQLGKLIKNDISKIRE